MIKGTFKFESDISGSTNLIGGEFTIEDTDHSTRRISYIETDREWFAEVPPDAYSIDAIAELIRVRLGLDPKIAGGVRPLESRG